MFGCNGKFHFPEIHFLLTNIYSFDPELILHSYFRFKSFPEKEREREREREKKEPRSERERGRRESRRDRPTSEKKQNGDRPTSALIGRSRLSSIAASRTIAPISPPISSRAARSHLLLRCTDLLLRSRLHRFDEFFCWVLLFL